MLATSGDLPADQQRWAFEVKWDGVRALAYVKNGQLTLESRNLADITARYPELGGMGSAIGTTHRAILDGEVVAFDEAGRPSFQQLQARMHLTGREEIRQRQAEVPVAYLLFDVLWVDDGWVIERPYAARRELLARLIEPGPTPWQVAPSHTGEGTALAEASRQQGLEGVVAKRLDSPYEPGRRSRWWIKTKNFLRHDFVIGGWVPGQGGRTGQIGSLMLGYYDDSGVLQYAGKVGTGFTQQELERLARLLRPLAQTENPFAETPPDWRVAHYTEPKLVAQVSYGHWTAAGQVRHSSYHGLRDDMPAEQVRREESPPLAPPLPPQGDP
jgi:bifunctional non-homologous end joining protein LigD